MNARRNRTRRRWASGGLQLLAGLVAMANFMGGLPFSETPDRFRFEARHTNFALNLENTLQPYTRTTHSPGGTGAGSAARATPSFSRSSVVRQALPSPMPLQVSVPIAPPAQVERGISRKFLGVRWRLALVESCASPHLHPTRVC